MKLQFGQEVLCLPGSILSHCQEANEIQLRTLLWLASDLSLADKPKQLAALVRCDLRSAKTALRFWIDAGLLSDETEESVCTMAQVDENAQDQPKSRKKEVGATVKTSGAKQAEKRLVRRADVLPTYTSDELVHLLEKREEMRILMDEAQRIIGKMFNPSEINIMVGMVDYLGMDTACVLLLLAHCKQIGKTNLRAIEKYAYSLVDNGITETDSLEEWIRRTEEIHSFEGELRTLFGLKSRSFTAKETKMLHKWLEYGYGIEMVRRAYDLTISAINEPSMAYANSILERWNTEGVRTPEDADAEIAQKALEKGEGKTLGNSFDTDDFFEAALQRSFGQTDTPV